MRVSAFLVCLLVQLPLVAQDINVEYDKNRDLSRYKTFTLGSGEIITPKDRRTVNEASLHRWVKDAITKELTAKGMVKVDSAGDLLATYLIGTQQRSDFSQLGPLGVSPDNSSQTWSRDYTMGNLIIDLNDRNNNLIWRVNATTGSAAMDINVLIEQVVSAGFKKFSLKPKKVKKKK
ncbi:MAG: DUF4136 domain-containing protein [Cyclobacteriaceae bacterium]|nr:DUF4136 domain-containing protein [Cyclobacteriaceae bacterium]